MEDIKKSDVHLTSAAAFVEGGIQDACDDACSICLEAFCDSDPSTVTSCKHEFHLQCILECQELLEAVEWERSFRFNPSRNATIFHHPTLGDFELQHLPMGASDAELEERIIQHLAAAAAMGRARHIARREGQRNRASAQGRPQFLVYSTHPNAPSATLASSSPDQSGPISAITLAFPSPLSAGEESSQLTASSTLPSTQAEPVSALASGLSVVSHQQGSSLNNRRSPTQSSPSSQDRPGPSAFQSFSESLKSRFNAVSMRYKESISKSTRGWKERLFSRKTSMADLGSEVKKEVNAGIATVSRMMERLETRDGSRTTDASVSNSLDGSAPASDNRQRSDTDGDSSLSNPNVKASCAAGFSSN